MENVLTVAAVHKRRVHGLDLPGVEPDRVLPDLEHNPEHRQAQALRARLPERHRRLDLPQHQRVRPPGQPDQGRHQPKARLALRQLPGLLRRLPQVPGRRRRGPARQAQEHALQQGDPHHPRRVGHGELFLPSLLPASELECGSVFC